MTGSTTRMELCFLKELKLASSAMPGRPDFLCAASGLIRIQKNFYVIADDELGLGRFPTVGPELGELIPIFPGQLPPVRPVI